MLGIYTYIDTYHKRNITLSAIIKCITAPGIIRHKPNIERLTKKLFSIQKLAQKLH